MSYDKYGNDHSSVTIEIWMWTNTYLVICDITTWEHAPIKNLNVYACKLAYLRLVSIGIQAGRGGMIGPFPTSSCILALLTRWDGFVGVSTDMRGLGQASSWKRILWPSNVWNFCLCTFIAFALRSSWSLVTPPYSTHLSSCRCTHKPLLTMKTTSQICHVLCC